MRNYALFSIPKITPSTSINYFLISTVLLDILPRLARAFLPCLSRRRAFQFAYDALMFAKIPLPFLPDIFCLLQQIVFDFRLEIWLDYTLVEQTSQIRPPGVGDECQTQTCRWHLMHSCLASATSSLWM